MNPISTPRLLLFLPLAILAACTQPEDTLIEDSTTVIDNLAADIRLLEAAVSAAELEVERLRDVEEIENLMSAYGYYVDKSMHDDVSDLFADDATLEILGRGVFYGIERIRAYMHNFGDVGPKDGNLFNHMPIQHVVTVAPDGRTALARARLFVMFGIVNVAGQFGEGTYENELVKEDGVWKFKYLHAYQGHYTIYEDGWAKKASGIFAPYERFPPDDPQSVEYDPYPAAFVPPFHYENPVTGN